MGIRKRTAFGLTRSGSRQLAGTLAELVPDEAREFLAPHAKEYCEALLADIRDPDADGHRTAMATYPRIMRMIGANEELLEAILAAIGAPSVEKAQAAWNAVNNLGEDPHKAAEECRKYLAWYDGPNGPGRDKS